MTTLIVFGLTALAFLVLVITLRMAGVSLWQFFRDIYWPFGGANYFDVMETVRQDLSAAPEAIASGAPSSPSCLTSRVSASPRSASHDRSASPTRMAPPKPAQVASQATVSASPTTGVVAASASPPPPPSSGVSVVSAPRPALASKVVEPQGMKPDRELPAPLLGDAAILSIARRRHTAIVGVTGDGKTTCSYTLLVRDLADGCQCVVVSRHFSPYHDEDQRIDLRPLAHLFEAYRTPADIAAALEQVATIIDARLDDYYANRPIGHPLVVYLGEWRSLRRMMPRKRANEIFEKILDEGRKVKVWAVVELHSALIAYMGSDSGTREAFGTCLVGNVDPTSWKTLMGSCAQYPVPLGYWATEHGMVRIIPPSSAVIADLARRPAPAWDRLIPAARPSGESTPAMSDDRQESPVLPKETAASDTARRASIHPEVIRALANIETVEELSRLLLLANGGQRTRVRRLVRGDNVALSELLNRLVEELGL